MKLKKLILGTMVAAVAFTACNEKDDFVPQGDQDAYISLGATGNIVSKADANAIASEEFIEHLTAIVFDNNGKFVALKDTTSTASPKASVDQIAHIKVKVADYDASTVEYSTTTFQVVLVANAYDQVKNVTSLDDLKTKTSLTINNYNYSAETKPYVPMVSEVLQVTNVKKETENWAMIGATKYGTNWDGEASAPAEYTPVPLTRLVARVQLESLATNFTGTYEGATFKLGKVFLANIAGNSFFVEQGAKNSFQNSAAGFYRGNTETFDKIDEIVFFGSTNNAMFGKAYENKEITSTPYTFANDMFISYMFENQGLVANTKGGFYTTRLILQGEIILANGQSLGTKFYHIELKGVLNGENVLVKANTVYKISATITGEGSPKEDEILKNACIAARVTIAPWRVVEQIEDDIN